MIKTTNEKVPFRFIDMPCCHHQVCWINPRLPNYCPECGQFVAVQIKESVIVNKDAWLSVER